MSTTEDRREQRHGHAPEDGPLARTVGASGLEQVARNRGEARRDHHHREAGPHPDVGQHVAGRISPLRARRSREARERLRADPARYERARPPRTRTSRRARWWSSRPRRLSFRNSTVTPGRPSSPSSSSPGRAAAGLEVSPDHAVDPARERLGHDRLLGPAGTSDSRIAVTPSCATAPGSSGCSSTGRRRPRPERLGQGRAAKGPGRRDGVLHDRDRGVDRPWSGLFSYASRQITPAAKSEIAIGMNTTTLNATEKRMRSRSTAKTSRSR